MCTNKQETFITEINSYQYNETGRYRVGLKRRENGFEWMHCKEMLSWAGDIWTEAGDIWTETWMMKRKQQPWDSLRKRVPGREISCKRLGLLMNLACLRNKEVLKVSKIVRTQTGRQAMRNSQATVKSLSFIPYEIWSHLIFCFSFRTGQSFDLIYVSKDHSGGCAMMEHRWGNKESRQNSRQLNYLIQRKTNGSWLRLNCQMGHVQKNLTDFLLLWLAFMGCKYENKWTRTFLIVGNAYSKGGWLLRKVTCRIV